MNHLSQLDTRKKCPVVHGRESYATAMTTYPPHVITGDAIKAQKSGTKAGLGLINKPLATIKEYGGEGAPTVGRLGVEAVSNS